MAALSPVPGGSPLSVYVGVQQKFDKEMSAILMDAAKRAESIIQKSAGSKGIGAAVDRAKMQQASRELRKQAAEMWGGPITASMKSGMESAAVAAVRSETFVNDVLQKAMGVRFEALEQAFDFHAQNSVDNLYAKANNGIPLADSVYRSQALAQGTVEREINRAVALQQSAGQLATAVRSLISPMVAGGISYAANRLARTEINNSFHRAQIDRRQNEPWTTGMRWHLSGSHPKPDLCNEYAAHVAKAGSAPGVYLSGDIPGKPHPNCLCFLTTEVIGEDEFIDEFLKGNYNEYMDQQIYSSGIGTAC